MRLRATIRPVHGQTQILVTEDGEDRLRAVLPGPPQHPGALRMLLEGLALWRDRKVDAVLVVEGPWARSHVEAHLEDDLWAQGNLARVRFDIRPRRKPRRLRGPGDFRLLYQLHGGHQ